MAMTLTGVIPAAPITLHRRACIAVRPVVSVSFPPTAAIRWRSDGLWRCRAAAAIAVHCGRLAARMTNGTTSATRSLCRLVAARQQRLARKIIANDRAAECVGALNQGVDNAGPVLRGLDRLREHGRGAPRPSPSRPPPGSRHVIGDQQDASVRMKGRVHRSPAELQEFLRLELGIENRTQRRVVARNDQVFPVRAITRDLGGLLMPLQRDPVARIRKRLEEMRANLEAYNAMEAAGSGVREGPRSRAPFTSV
jgi:hypothetical protein